MSEVIDLTAADGHVLSAYRSGPADASGGLVIVQEIFGVNPHIRRVADAFGQEGYAVIAPALFDRVERNVALGYGGDDVARGRGLRMKLAEANTVADIEAAARALGVRKLGIVGYCFGGTVSWWGATRTSLFAAAVGWYGGGIIGSRTAEPHCPVQLHFGETDSSIPLTDVEAIRAAQPGVEIFVYGGAGHGFGCDERASYSRVDAELAQARTLAFLRRYLG